MEDKKFEESEQSSIESIRDANWNNAFQVYNALLKKQKENAIRKTDLERINQWVKMIKEKYDV